MGTSPGRCEPSRPSYILNFVLRLLARLRIQLDCAVLKSSPLIIIEVDTIVVARFKVNFFYLKWSINDPVCKTTLSLASTGFTMR